MPDHAAFLKGMNLGRRRITNDELRAAVESLGLEEVQSFRASGNLVFAAGRRSSSALQKTFEQGLQETLGYEVPTFLRSAAELREIASARPFSRTTGTGKLQVALLHEAPAAAVRERVLALSDEEDLLSFGARELYWLPSRGVGRSALDWKAIEQALGAATVRTSGTIEQIVARWFA